jgi:hypothetical protein
MIDRALQELPGESKTAVHRMPIFSRGWSILSGTIGEADDFMLKHGEVLWKLF